MIIIRDQNGEKIKEGDKKGTAEYLVEKISKTGQKIKVVIFFLKGGSVFGLLVALKKITQKVEMISIDGAENLEYTAYYLVLNTGADEQRDVSFDLVTEILIR